MPQRRSGLAPIVPRLCPQSIQPGAKGGITQNVVRRLRSWCPPGLGLDAGPADRRHCVRLDTRLVWPATTEPTSGTPAWLVHRHSVDLQRHGPLSVEHAGSSMPGRRHTSILPRWVTYGSW